MFLYKKSTPEDDSYIAAVVEMNPKDDTMENLEQCINIIKEAAEKNVDVIVFPEKAITIHDSVEIPISGTLTEFPVPADNEDLYNKVLVDLSTAAKTYEMYVVVNLRERVNCTTPNENRKCPGKQVYLFNTNVVFDRKGAVIMRASKYHLFFEPEFTEEIYPNVSKFSTDFNVTFGAVISFDLLFTIPTGELVTQMQLKNIIMTSNWCPEPPFLGSK
ncbi:hypothetical protein O3G_MSEX011434 [Manduca sexta]|uniref:CN hydrolase domain-containing protein n=1 Tax=Manduca sexta TaxID=7130 RepID=A0A922CU44_MANSE|nr:hypothetical protein O3G_MSEX011434 [Manduca sexta]